MRRALPTSCLLTLALACACAPDRPGASSERDSTPASAGTPAWGLLAPSAAPLKGLYFFVGDPPSGYGALWSQLPADANYTRWSSAEANRNEIVQQLVASNANTIVMSYWGDHLDAAGPMKPTAQSYDQLFAAVKAVGGGHLGILPAIEGVDGDLTRDPLDREPAASFGFGEPSPFLFAAVDALVQRYLKSPSDPSWPQLWTRMYDKTLQPVYAVNLLHLASMYDSSPSDFARSLDALSDAIFAKEQVRVGFTIDAWDAIFNRGAPRPGGGSFPLGYNPTPQNQALAGARWLLAIQSFNPEITVGGVDPQSAPYNGCANSCPPAQSCPCTDNNGNIQNIVAWKQKWIADWVNTGLPVILDVSSGYDGHYVFRAGYAGLYGDNSQDGINHAWRNGESQMKHFYANAATIKGVVYNAWNGFAEGLAAAPSYWQTSMGQSNSQLGVDNVALAWLHRQLDIDPRACDHVHFWNDGRTAHVYGDICNHWQWLGAAPVYGAPTTDQVATPGNRGQKNDFENGGTIYWYCPQPNVCSAFEVHGAINRLYHALQEDKSPLGLPTTDEGDEIDSTGIHYRANRFENGKIYWCNGMPSAAYVLCAPNACPITCPRS